MRVLYRTSIFQLLHNKWSHCFSPGARISKRNKTSLSFLFHLLLLTRRSFSSRDARLFFLLAFCRARIILREWAGARKSPRARYVVYDESSMRTTRAYSNSARTRVRRQLRHASLKYSKYRAQFRAARPSDDPRLPRPYTLQVFLRGSGGFSRRPAPLPRAAPRCFAFCSSVRGKSRNCKKASSRESAVAKEGRKEGRSERANVATTR